MYNGRHGVGWVGRKLLLQLFLGLILNFGSILRIPLGLDGHDCRSNGIDRK